MLTVKCRPTVDIVRRDRNDYISVASVFYLRIPKTTVVQEPRSPVRIEVLDTRVPTTLSTLTFE